MTVSQEIYENIYDWIDQILNQEMCLGFTIIESHQDIPKAKRDEVYMVIQYSPTNIDRIGRPTKTEVDSNGKRNLINDYVGILELREVNGDGEYLRVLLESLDRQDIIDYWSSKNLSQYTEGSVINIPRIQETNWKKEALVELTIGYATATKENIGYIENVEFEGTVPSQGREGSHTVENN
jgi:hypothetical protein